MNWVKTYFEMTGTESAIELLRDQLFINDIFTVHKLYRIPKRLLIRSNSLVSEIIMFFNYLEESGYHPLSFRLRDFYRNDITEFLSKNDLNSLVYQLGKDIKGKRLDLDLLFTEYLETYRKDISQLVIKHIRNYKETGYYNASDYYLYEIGSGSHPVNSEIVTTPTSIKGSFYTTLMTPFMLFRYLKEHFKVEITVSCFELDTGDHYQLNDDFEIIE